MHSLVAAPTGAGEGVGVVIPTLLTYPGSTVVLDVKGENYEKTAARRHELGDQVFKFAPMRRIGAATATTVRRGCGGASTTAVLRDAAARQQPGRGEGQGTESWVDGAREIFAATAVVAHRARDADDRRGLRPVDRSRRAGKLLEGLAASTKSGRPGSVFNRFAGQPEKVLGSWHVGALRRGLRLWADPDVRDATAATDFWITDFRSGPGERLPLRQPEGPRRAVAADPADVPADVHPAAGGRPD